MALNHDWPVIILFHGSRNPEANTKARVLVKRFAAQMPTRRVEVAFLCQTNPLLTDAIKNLAADNPRRITIVPAFLFKGTHVTNDIAASVSEAKKEFPVQKVVVADPIGACPELIDILQQRLKDSEIG